MAMVIGNLFLVFGIVGLLAGVVSGAYNIIGYKQFSIQIVLSLALTLLGSLMMN